MALKSDGVFLTSRIPAGASVPEEQSILSKIERKNTGIDGSGQVRGADKAAMNPSASSHPAKAQVAKSSWRLRTRHSLLHLPRIVDLGVFGQKKRQHAVDEPKTSNKTRQATNKLNRARQSPTCQQQVQVRAPCLCQRYEGGSRAGWPGAASKRKELLTKGGVICQQTS